MFLNLYYIFSKSGNFLISCTSFVKIMEIEKKNVGVICYSNSEKSSC